MIEKRKRKLRWDVRYEHATYTYTDRQKMPVAVDGDASHDGKAFGSRQTVCLLLPVSVCAEIVTDGKWQWKHAGLFVARSRLRPITRDNGGTRDVELASNTCRLVVD